MAQRVWHPTTKTLATIAKRVKVGDAISNPVCRRGMTRASHTARDAAYKLADNIDAALAKRGLKADHPHTCVWFIEKAR